MADTLYTLSQATDFSASHACASDRFQQEIQLSSIATALDFINIVGDAVSVYFKAALGATDFATFHTLASIHSGMALPNQAQPVSVTSSVLFSDRIGSGTISGTNQSVVANTQGAQTVTFQTSGSWNGTVVLEANVGSDWFAVQGVLEPASVIAGSFGPANQVINVNCGGFQQVRLRASGWTSGTGSVFWGAGAGLNTVWAYNNDPRAMAVGCQGNVGEGSNFAGNAVRVAGIDENQNVRSFRTDSSGSQHVLASLGNVYGKTNVMRTGSLASSAATADQVIMTYTVSAGKTFYLQYVGFNVRLTTFLGTATLFGTISLESPAGTKLITEEIYQAGQYPACIYNFDEPIPIPAGTVIRVVCTPSAVTGFTWRANFGGYERLNS
jgi:hypothetical protein